MKNFSERIPEDILMTPNVRRFMKVLDGLNDQKQEWMLPYDYAFNYMANVNLNILQKFFYELGQMDLMGGMPEHLLKQFILNAWDIFHLKGTKKGERLLARCLMDADIETDTTLLYGRQYLQPDDPYYGILPDGADLLNAGTTAFIYAYDHEDLSDYYTSMEVRLIGPYFYVPEFRSFVAKILPDFLCMVDIRTCSLDVKFYGHSYIYSITSNLLPDGSL